MLLHYKTEYSFYWKENKYLKKIIQKTHEMLGMCNMPCAEGWCKMLQWRRRTVKPLVLTVNGQCLYQVADPFSDDRKLFLQAASPQSWEVQGGGMCVGAGEVCVKSSKVSSLALFATFTEQLLLYLPNYCWTFSVMFTNCMCQLKVQHFNHKPQAPEILIIQHFKNLTDKTSIYLWALLYCVMYCVIFSASFFHYPQATTYNSEPKLRLYYITKIAV